MRINQISKYQSKANIQPQRVPLFSQSTATPASKPNSINNIIQCPLCSESIQQSHMCPSCCKLFCQSCIKTWIKNKKSECPSCLKPLTVNNLVNCSMLGRQIEQALSRSVNKMKNPPMSASVLPSPPASKIFFQKSQGLIYESPQISKNSDPLCQKHQLKLQYFCEQCCMALCSDCAVLSSNHLAHRICKLSHKKMKLKEKVSQLQKNGSIYKLNALKLRDQLSKKGQNAKFAEKDKQIILNSYVQHIFRNNFHKYDQMINSKEQLLRSCCLKLEGMTETYQNFSNKIQQLSKAQLVKKGQQIKCQISQVLTKELSNPDPINILPKIDWEVVPEFEQKTYILDNYNHLRQKGDILVSEPLYCKGTQWRLKIFPSGINHSPNKPYEQFLAIHLLLSKGHQISNCYRYRLQLVNQANRSKCMSFESQHYFRQGSQWHLDNFIPISTLYTDNFINPLGYIQIILYIRCLSYFHAVQDQKQIIAIKQAQMNRNSLLLSNLKKKAKETGIKIDSVMNSPAFGRNPNEIRMSGSNKIQNKRVIAIDRDVQ